MNLLCIDTALETASIGMVHNGMLIAVRENSSQMDHAAWIHTAIKGLVTATIGRLDNLSAVAVTSGPGSYTGLRVGMATAKGLCFALQLPFITENILLITAMRARKVVYEGPAPTDPRQNVVFCPMIDARRMEVFTAAYDEHLQVVQEPHALVLDQNSFADYLDESRVVFCGNGSDKLGNILSHPNAIFLTERHTMADFAETALKKLQMSAFSDLAYQEPDYFKNFYGGK